MRKKRAAVSKRTAAYHRALYSTYSHTATFCSSKNLEMLKREAYVAQSGSFPLPEDK